MTSKLAAVALVAALCAPAASAQYEAAPISTFGYFQNSFEYVRNTEQDWTMTSFIAQQLNVFFQKDLGRRWTTFVDFEVVNNFSSARQWGAFSLEEAWVRYRASRPLNVKVGLQIPTFNNLNEIKNRTPLLPYIIRPLVYEASLGESIAIEEYVPGRAYVQVYGFLPLGQLKLDHALYLGNSPNVNDRRVLGQTGVDTTDTFLVGGRVGLRYADVKAGVSATRDHRFLPEEVESFLPRQKGDEEATPRTRLGADLSFHLGRFYGEGELINVRYDDGVPGFGIDRRFYYATFGYYATDRLFAYLGYWIIEEGVTAAGADTEVDIDVPTGGASFRVNDMVTLKLQYGRVDIQAAGPLADSDRLHYYTAAVSAVF